MNILKDSVENCIINCENEYCIMYNEKSYNRKYYQCKNMLTQLQNDSDFNLITHGYSVHLLNLLAEDLNIPNVKEQILFIVNCFRNNYFANVKYRE